MMNAIGDRKERLAEAISLLPNFLRESNTTFVNLRAALDDLDPLVDASKPVAIASCGRFSPTLRAASADAVPTIRDLDAILRRRGDANDLVELTRLQPALAKAAVGSGSPDCGGDPTDLGRSRQTPQDDNFTPGRLRRGGLRAAQLRAAALDFPRLHARAGRLVRRLRPLRLHRRDRRHRPDRHDPQPLQLSLPGGHAEPRSTRSPPTSRSPALDTGNTRRCPGGNEHPVNDIDPSDDSVPFTDGGALTDDGPGNCDPTQTAPGS